jgi:hypothetical protein
MVYATHKNGDFGDGLLLGLPHDPYLLMAIAVPPMAVQLRGELKFF